MNKYQLIEVLAMHEGLSFKTAEVIVNTLFTNISESLVPGERAEIRDFGSFKVKKRGSLTISR